VKKLIKTVLTGLLFVPVLALAFNSFTLISTSVKAEGSGVLDGAKIAMPTDTTVPDSLPESLKKVTNVALYVIGALSVIMLIYGGIRYVTSAGESARVAEAKNTIMYSIIGVVVALLAYAIVNFVIVNLTATA